METMKQTIANAILELPDTVNFSDIMAVLESFRVEFENDSLPPEMEGISAYELAKDLLGCVDGPPDLSTNKAYTETKAMSFLEAAKEYVGCIKDGPPDLSTNKVYLSRE